MTIDPSGTWHQLDLKIQIFCNLFCRYWCLTTIIVMNIFMIRYIYRGTMDKLVSLLMLVPHGQSQRSYLHLHKTLAMVRSDRYVFSAYVGFSCLHNPNPSSYSLTFLWFLQPHRSWLKISNTFTTLNCLTTCSKIAPEYFALYSEFYKISQRLCLLISQFMRIYISESSF